ncbi:pilin [Pseudomonas oryzihabitans]|uniref:pilin n=1 Tax=Pseudomonas oryzihabitans TaxID=47885 RepID=UPI0011A0BF73|nr:pilin [Pseudomonas oryzihabitans]
MKAQKGFTLIELMIVVAIIGILAAIAIPQYQNYVARSQVARVMSEAGSLRTAVENCVLNGRTTVGTGAGECDPGATGSNLLTGASQTGATLPANTGVPQVTIGTNATTASTVVASFGNNSAPVLASTALTWTRAPADGTWRCFTTAPANLRPAGCAASQ